MPKTTAAIAAELALIYQNVAWAYIGDASGLQPAAAAGNFRVGLHTASPGLTGDQATNEATYTGYGRVAVARSGAGFTIAAPQVTNTAVIYFPGCTGGSEVLTHWSLGTAASGAGNLLRYGPLCGAFKGFTAATDDNITAPGHTLILNDRVVFYPEGEATFPTGLTAGTVYYVIAPSGDAFQVSLTEGGSPVSISAAGAGVCAEAAPFSVSAGKAPYIAAGALVIVEH